MFTSLVGCCGYEKIVDRGEPKLKMSSYLAILADVIVGVALLAIGGLVASNVLSLTPIATYTTFAVGGAQMGFLFFALISMGTHGYGRKNPLLLASTERA
jgi:hypothetical protein